MKPRLADKKLTDLLRGENVSTKEKLSRDQVVIPLFCKVETSVALLFMKIVPI